MILFVLLQRLFSWASLALLGAGGWLLFDWWNDQRVAEALDLPEPGNAQLYWALGLLAWSVLGRLPMLLLLGKGGATPHPLRGEGVRVPAPDGSTLWVETTGREDGPILVFTHGWGMNVRIWAEARKQLGDRFGLCFWDLPGAGRSTRPRSGFSIEGFSEDLHAVIDTLPEHRPIVLVGHSIGGMATLTFCARHPELLNGRVAGIVLENTTHTNPLRTMIFSRVFKPLQPVVEGLSRFAMVTSPLMWVMNWQSYLSGSTHLAMRLAGFGCRPTREQLDRAALLPTRTSPSVQARGNLAMFRWSVTERLPSIDCPALVFVGGRDLVTKDHAGETIADALPQARLVRMERAGHMGPVEEAGAYNEQIAVFADFVDLLSSRDPARAGRSFAPRRGEAEVVEFPRDTRLGFVQPRY